MPSPFEQAFAAQVTAMYLTYGLPATYTEPNGTEISCTIIVTREPSHEVPRPSRASGEIQSGEIRVRLSEVPRVMKGSRFVVENVEVWTVETIPVVKNGQSYATCSRGSVGRLMATRAKE